MLKINKKNENLRRNLHQKEFLRLVLKSLQPFFYKIANSQKKYLLNLQSQLLVNSNITKVRSICILTGRSRSVYRSFKLSRLKLREYGQAGYFTGLSKASW
jgi:small subunit ribosomal protein S14